MVPVHQHKYAEELMTPVLLFDCTLADGQVERWSTHKAKWQNLEYSPRVLGHSGFNIGLLADDGADWGNRMTVALVNTDGYVTHLHHNENLKGCTLLVSFAFIDPESGQLASSPEAVFAGIGDAPEELTTSVGRINFISRFSLQRLALPQTRIQASCPWCFPRNAAERVEAVNGGPKGVHSRFYPCGYSADQSGGCGNQGESGNPFNSCARTKADCVERGMWQQDTRGQETARFGGFQFLPSTSLVRSSGSSQRFWSQAVDRRAMTNDAVPLIYGTVRYTAPVIWTWNDGNFLICEVLVGSGPIQGISRLWVNGIELPLRVPGTNMSATGWYDLLTTGSKNGVFDPNFTDSQGKPASDPHGSLGPTQKQVHTERRTSIITSTCSGRYAPRSDHFLRLQSLPSGHQLASALNIRQLCYSSELKARLVGTITLCDHSPSIPTPFASTSCATKSRPCPNSKALSAPLPTSPSFVS